MYILCLYFVDSFDTCYKIFFPEYIVNIVSNAYIHLLVWYNHGIISLVIADIVFMRTWYPVEVPQFYATVTSLLLPPAEKAAWVGMKTLGQLKRERSIMAPPKEDSLYKVGNNKEH